MIRLNEERDYPSPDDLLDWLRLEVMNVAKAAELRVNEATDIVTAYAKGKIKPQEATRRWHSYSHRWGDAIPGVFSSEGKTDKEILREMDETRREEKKFSAKVRRSQAENEKRGGGHSP